MLDNKVTRNVHFCPLVLQLGSLRIYFMQIFLCCCSMLAKHRQQLDNFFVVIKEKKKKERRHFLPKIQNHTIMLEIG